MAGGYAKSYGLWTKANAWVSACGSYDSETYGWRLGATSYADANVGGACWGEAWARAKTWGRVDGDADAGGGGSAGPDNPFGELDPDPMVLRGRARANVANTVSNGRFIVYGQIAYNPNGFVEIAVLNIKGLSQMQIDAVVSQYASVEKALQGNAISANRVLGRWRETDFVAGPDGPSVVSVTGGGRFLPMIVAPEPEFEEQGRFVLPITLNGLTKNDILVSLVIHAISPASETTDLEVGEEVPDE